MGESGWGRESLCVRTCVSSRQAHLPSACRALGLGFFGSGEQSLPVHLIQLGLSINFFNNMKAITYSSQNT